MYIIYTKQTNSLSSIFLAVKVGSAYLASKSFSFNMVRPCL